MSLSSIQTVVFFVIYLAIIRLTTSIFNREDYHDVDLSSCQSVFNYSPSALENNLIYKLPRNHSAYSEPANMVDISLLIASKKGYVSTEEHSYIHWNNVRYFARNNVAVTVPAKSMFSNIMDHARKREDTGCFNKCDKLPPKDPTTNMVDNTNLGLTHGDLIDTMANAVRVLVMRDPYDRLLSAYYNSFEHPGIYVGNCCQVRNGACADNPDGSKHYRSCSLKEFVIQIGKDISNDHVKPQVDASRFGVIYYHHIIRVSTIKDVECLFALIGEKYEGGHNESPNTSIDTEKKASYFDLEMTQIIREVYKDDVMLWKMIQSFPGATRSVMNYLGH